MEGFYAAVPYLINIAPHPNFLNIQNDDWLSALHVAVLTKHPAIVRSLILAGCNPNLRSIHGNTALHLACEAGDLKCVKAILRPFTLEEKRALKRNFPIRAQDLELRNYDGEFQ